MAWICGKFGFTFDLLDGCGVREGGWFFSGGYKMRWSWDMWTRDVRTCELSIIEKVSIIHASIPLGVGCGFSCWLGGLYGSQLLSAGCVLGGWLDDLLDYRLLSLYTGYFVKAFSFKHFFYHLFYLFYLFRAKVLRPKQISQFIFWRVFRAIFCGIFRGFFRSFYLSLLLHYPI